MDLKLILNKLRACDDAIKWAEGKTIEEAWNTCERVDWSLWFATRRNVDIKLITKVACACSRLSLKHIPAGELRPLRAIEAAEAWTDGKADMEEVKKAADAAHAAYADVSASAAYADVSASAASYVAYVVAYAAADADASYAAYAAAYAAGSAADVAARSKSSKECADIVRQYIPLELVM